jgi:membrane-associated phospholipid phosphatase
MAQIGVFLMAIFFFFQGNCFAQLVSAPQQSQQDRTFFLENESLSSFGGFIKDTLTDTRDILTSPVKWEKSDWLTFSLASGTTLGLFAFDHEIQQWVQKNRNSTTDRVAWLASFFGDGGYTLPALGAIYLYGYIGDNKLARTTASLALESFLVSGVFVQGIKFITGRHRPSDGEGAHDWDGPSISIFKTGTSFPSAESASAFAVMTVIASQYRDTRWVPPLAYGVATLTALARINQNQHWASDVFLGSAIGYFTAQAIMRLHKKREQKVGFIPIIDDHVRGLALYYEF